MKLLSKIIALASAGAMLLAQTAGISAEEKVYIALGDSISAGYGLEDAGDCYVSKLGASIGAQTENYSVNGFTAEQLIEQLGEKDISGADIITVSIGSNNLLKPFCEILCSTSGAESVEQIGQKIDEMYGDGGLAGLMNLSQFFGTLKTALTDNETLYAACDLFVQQTFPQIVTLLKEKAPSAKLYITNVYNPYYGVDVVFAGTSYLPLGELADVYISRINKAFDSASADYTLVDAYSAFNAQGLTNVSISLDNIAESSFDPHPNAAGHDKLFSMVNVNTLPPVEGVLYGDIDRNGVLRLNDLSRLCKACANYITLTAEDNPEADCYRDGVIDSKDLIKLGKFFAEFDVVLGTAD